MKIQLRHPLAKIPTRNKPWDSGADLYSVEHNVVIMPGQYRIIDTGVAIELPDSYVAFICPRSGLASCGITIVNAPGVIDSGFRGTIKVNMINLGQEEYCVHEGDRIAQMVIQQCVFPDFIESPQLSITERGENEHGSSGR